MVPLKSLAESIPMIVGAVVIVVVAIALVAIVGMVLRRRP
jgi:hypothetical protein